MKKIFLSLLLGFVGLISFSNAGNYVYEGDISFRGGGYKYAFGLPIPTDLSKDVSLTCEFSNVNNIVSSSNYNVVSIYLSSSHSIAYYVNTSIMFSNSQSFTTNIKTDNGAFAVGFQCYSESCETNFHYVCTFSGTDILSCPECETCPEVNTGDILSGSCDTNYCVENGLCPTASGSWSELKINDVVHEGRPFINLLIPDYIHWDYSVDENQYDIYVGSGYDQDYIDSVLKINSYRPDSADFTDTFVSGLTLIFPYIFVALLIVFIWKLLKRIFK